MHLNDTIIALATPPGAGAIAVIRLSGPDALQIASDYFTSTYNKKLKTQKSHTILLGNIVDGAKTYDQVLVSIFKNPHSYTGEDVVEISCHGSHYIQQQIIQLFLRNGCRMADAGEFTLRAFLNGKLDLSQAEAVADLIASDNEASHQIAIQQMRGGFSSEIKALRDELLNFASLIELELDFAEEDVEFANRDQFKALLNQIQNVLKRLIDSFAVGNVIKNGIPVAIVGEPNVGKSTLLNALLNEERAIVSEIAGTTRDTIEDEIAIGGIGFRFIDTAGIRKTEDIVEGIGIRKTFEKIEKAQVVVYLIDSSVFLSEETSADLPSSRLGEDENFAPLLEIERIHNKYAQKPIIAIVNKTDLLDDGDTKNLKVALQARLNKIFGSDAETVSIQMISAKTGEGVEELKSTFLEHVHTGALRNDETIVTNSRHYDALLKALAAIEKVNFAMDDGVSGDLLALDIREALNHFGEITGEITSDDLLGNIFANFCIGK